MLAMLTVFAMLGCAGPDDPVADPITTPDNDVTVTFNPYTGAPPLSFTLAANEELGAARLAQVTALESRDGLAFAGWSLTGDGEPVTVSAISKWNVNTAYYGLWKDHVTVSFIAYDEATPLTFDLAINGALGADNYAQVTALQTRAGYTFRHWSLANGTEAAVDADSSWGVDAAYYGVWEQTEITVTFIAYDGAAPMAFIIPENEALGAVRYAQVEALQTTRSGYLFTGWSLTDGGSPVTVNADSKWTAVATYYGLWEQTAITVTFIAYNEADPLAITLNKDEALGADNYAQVTALQARGGYTFKSWLTGGNPVTVSAISTWNADTTLYGLWSITVTFDPDYTGADPLPITIDVNEALGADNYALVTALETRGGYEFKGWSLSKGGDAVTVNANSAWSAAAAYYGLWQEEVAQGQNITITYHLNGLPASQPAAYTATSGEAIGSAALPSLTPTDSSYTFLGWSLTEDGELITAAAIFNSATTLYARYDKYITITYNLNGFPGSAPAVKTVKAGEAIGSDALPALSATGYNWLGWATSANGSVISATESFTANQTLFARYTQNITITYNMNGFPGATPANHTAISGQAIGAGALPSRSADGYNWLGWATSANGSVIDGTAVFTANQTLFARYTRVTITLTYNLNGFPGSAPAAKTVNHGDPIGLDALPELSAPGYYWQGWATTTNGSVITANASFTENQTLYARYTAPSAITITYNLNDFPVKPTNGTGITSSGSTTTASGETTSSGRKENLTNANQPVFYAFAPANRTAIGAIGADAITPLTTDVPGYTWLGWSTTPTGAVVNANTSFAANTTLYARYNFSAPSFTPPASLNFDIPYDLHPLRTNISNDWIRGVDISNCWEIEQYGGKYKNFNGQVEDIMKILIDNGVNYVRLRLWVNPDDVTNHYPGDGNTNMAVIKVIAARAKAAGMKILLDYHYSDYWADPGQQYIPKSWNVPNQQAIYDKVEAYTQETIQ